MFSVVTPWHTTGKRKQSRHLCIAPHGNVFVLSTHQLVSMRKGWQVLMLSNWWNRTFLINVWAMGTKKKLVSPCLTVPTGQKHPSTQGRMPHSDWLPHDWTLGQKEAQAGPQGSYTNPFSHCRAVGNHRQRREIKRITHSQRQDRTLTWPKFIVWTGATYDRALGTSSVCRPHGGYTPQRRQRWLCRDIHSLLRSHN